jgi:hypothetical protein
LIPNAPGEKSIARFPVLKRHQGTSSIKSSRVPEAVFTGHVAVMGDMETHGFDYSPPSLPAYRLDLGIIGVKHPVLDEIRDILQCFQERLPLRILRRAAPESLQRASHHN